MINQKLLESYMKVVAFRHKTKKRLVLKDLDRVLYLAERYIEIHDNLCYDLETGTDNK